MASKKANEIKGSSLLTIYILRLITGSAFGGGIAFGLEGFFFGADVAESLAWFEGAFFAFWAETVGLGESAGGHAVGVGSLAEFGGIVFTRPFGAFLHWEDGRLEVFTALAFTCGEQAG